MTDAARRVSVGDVELSVHERGAGAPVLFVHGFPLDHSMWQGQWDGLPDGRLIAPDLRGFGASDVTPGTVSMELFADDLARLLDALGVQEPVTFCGLSMGGYIAWAFLRRHPQRVARLVLCDTRAMADAPEAAEGRRQMAARIESEGAQAVAAAMQPRLFADATLIEHPEIVEATRRVMLAQRPAGMAAAMRGMAARPDSRGELANIRVPTLVIVGEHDVISTADEMKSIARVIPNARLEVIAEAGHMAPLEQSAPVNAALQSFLRGA